MEEGTTEHIVSTLDKIGDRASYPNFILRNSKLSNNRSDAIKALREELRDLSRGNDREAIDAISAELKKTKDALSPFIEEAGEGAKEFKFIGAPEDFKEYAEKLNEYKKAKGQMHDFLSGKPYKPQGFNKGDEALKVSDDLRKAYTKAVSANGSVAKVMDGVFGKLRVDGLEDTLKHNLNFMDEAVTKGREKIVYGRVGGVGVGLAMSADAVFRSKSSDESRSMLVRALEFGAGVGIAGGSALAGAAR